MEKYIFDESNGLWYELQGDYYIPCLTISESKNYSIGIWGQRHKRWLKENRKVRYYNLITSGKLNSYLHDIDLLANETESRLIDEFAKNQNITEELKANDMMAWVGSINNIKNQVREIINKEIIYK
ncbi:MAG: TnpV protein [Ruminococcus sp.]|nr:TnpV protein [Ruminococcus sp.]